MQDSELLGAYQAQGDESAFGELVRRYVDLVYSTALRQVGGESGLAEEVTQAVFLLLAQKAQTLLAHPTVAGWLYRTTCHLAARAQRTEARRRARELHAAQMNPNEPDDPQIEQLLPLLDDALGALSESDRLALVLRFFMKRPMHDVGQALGVSEAAAKMRVGRALDRLRGYFVKHGLSCTSAGLMLVLADRSVKAAPLSLVSRVMSSLPAASLATAPSLMGTLILMSKTKIVVVILCALSLLGVYRLRHLSSDPAADPTRGSAELVRVTSNSSKSKPNARTLTLVRPDAVALSPESVAAEKLRAALGAPQPRGSIVWPDEEVIRQVNAFPDRQAAFEILKAAALHPSDLLGAAPGGSELDYLIRLRAISSMQFLAHDVPEVTPFLWETFGSEEAGTKADAFSTLKAIGFKPEDVVKLVDSLPTAGGSPALRRFVPEAIADLLAREPQAAAPALAALNQFLASADSHLRLSAASALAGTRLDQDPRIGEILADALRQADSGSALSIAEALARAGSKAAAFVPALLDLVKATPEQYLRAEYLRAVAAIQPAAAQTQPEVAQVLARDAQGRELGQKLNAESPSLDDLMAALRFPQHTVIAATRLGELGSAAGKAAPLLLHALEDLDEPARDQVVDALRRIDPKLQIERVDARTVANAVMNAEISLGAKGQNNEDPLTRFIMDKRKFSTWWTRDEVVSFATQLAAMDATASAAFADKILEADPTFSDRLPKQTK